MKKLIATLILTTVGLVCALPVAAQQRRVSPHETISAVIDGNRVTVTYGRPYTKNPRSGEVRKIWGSLVPYGKVWRTGADEATLLITQKPIVLGGTTVPAGAYTLWTLPQEDGSAKLIINKQIGQWVVGRWHLVCYHIDDEYSFSEVEAPLNDQELQLIRRADQVIVHSPALFERKGHLSPRTAMMPNGVDYAAYSRLAPDPDDLAPIPHPRIGYTGTIKRQLNWDLLLTLVARHPEWSFVFVGPVNPHPDIDVAIKEMARRPNVHFLGFKTVEKLSAYPQHFDTCIMPYLANDYTKYIYPLKLHEYLASGTPVVGTRIRSLRGES